MKGSRRQLTVTCVASDKAEMITPGTYTVTGYCDMDGNAIDPRGHDLIWCEISYRGIAGLTVQFNFEKELLELCRDATLRHVVIIHDAGTEIVTGPGIVIPNVDYIVFEHADTTVRNRITANALKLTELLLICRQCAVALQELHKKGIFHQDVKPSNLLIFPSSGGGAKDEIKLGDLGRASHVSKPGPFDNEIAPGDVTYMPLDLSYPGAKGSTDRTMIDGYSMGCVLFNLVTGVSYIQVLASSLFPHHLPARFTGTWGGSYSACMAYVESAHAKALVLVEDCLKNMSCQPELSDELIGTLQQLLDPDPAKRGHPGNKKANVSPCDMQRYVTQFDKLMNKAFVRGL